MRTNKVKELWRAGKPVSVGWCSTPDPYTTEAMARAGFDALILDMQHGMAIGPERAASWLQIVGQTDTTPIVRVPWNEPWCAQYVLDAGAMGLVFPLINSVEDAKKAIGSCRYPPIGYRSNGPNRAGFMGSDYFARANDEILCVLMMETAEGIAAQADIAQLPGVDGYFIGPTDLAIAMGLPPMLDHKAPEHVAAVQRIVDVAKMHGQTAGIYVTGVDEGVRRWRQGFNFNPICNDVWSITAAATGAVKRFAEAVRG